MTIPSVFRADTGPSCCHWFLPMRAAFFLRHPPLTFYRHHVPLRRLADASTDHASTHHRIRHAPIASHDRCGTI
jgi:hypothetical protein